MNVKDLVTSFPSIMKVTRVCANCMARKQSRKLIPQKSQTRARSVLKLIHTDVCGLFSIPSFHKSKYFITFMDDFSRKTWVHLLKKKYNVLFAFKTFKNGVDKEIGRAIKVLK